MRMTANLVLLAGLAVAATAVQAAEPGFAADVLPLLKSRCLMCHMPGAENGGLSLHPKTAYDSLVGAKATESGLLRVEPGKPEASYLYLKLTGEHLKAGGSGERMPFGEPALPAADIERVRAWIEAGAKP